MEELESVLIRVEHARRRGRGRVGPKDENAHRFLGTTLHGKAIVESPVALL